MELILFLIYFFPHLYNNSKWGILYSILRSLISLRLFFGPSSNVGNKKIPLDGGDDPLLYNLPYEKKTNLTFFLIRDSSLYIRSPYRYPTHLNVCLCVFFFNILFWYDQVSQVIKYLSNEQAGKWWNSESSTQLGLTFHIFHLICLGILTFERPAITILVKTLDAQIVFDITIKAIMI